MHISLSLDCLLTMGSLTHRPTLGNVYETLDSKYLKISPDKCLLIRYLQTIVC